MDYGRFLCAVSPPDRDTQKSGTLLILVLLVGVTIFLCWMIFQALGTVHYLLESVHACIQLLRTRTKETIP